RDHETVSSLTTQPMKAFTIRPFGGATGVAKHFRIIALHLRHCHAADECTDDQLGLAGCPSQTLETSIAIRGRVETAAHPLDPRPASHYPAPLPDPETWFCDQQRVQRSCGKIERTVLGHAFGKQHNGR